MALPPRDRVRAFGLAAAGYPLVIAIARLVLPPEQLGTITFRVEMQGASQGEYRNAAKFSPEEIIATPVLARVYEINDLERYGEFLDFATRSGDVHRLLKFSGGSGDPLSHLDGVSRRAAETATA